MAPTFIFSIAGQVLSKLSSPILEELSLAWGMRDDLRRLQSTISSVRAVLLDAQERQSSSHQLKNWLEKLEDSLYHAEDVVEEFEIDALRFRGSVQSMLRKVHRELSWSNRIVFRFKIAHKIKNIREQFDEIAADRNRFNLIERLDERIVFHREATHSFVKDEDVIGREDEREEVISFLMAMPDDKSVAVLPIVGLGGMGKTSLAKVVYNDKRVVEQFDLRIWVCISEDFELENVIKAILKSAKVRNCDKLQLEQSQECLRERLQNQKYLLILDDVWNENRTKWVELRNLLTSSANGSKIVITTRNQSVASIMTTSDYRLEIKSLSHKECLTLFFRWAFRSSQDAIRYPHLVEIADEIVKKCRGVPLAIRTLASLLYKKTDKNEWTNVRDSELWKIEQKDDDILPALKLSYNHLPTNLRRCFAFCSIYPKDYKFFSDKLAIRWRANGLLQQFGDHQDMEDVGISYIKQLWSRGFFEELKDFGSYMTFKIHDLIHDLALQVAERENIYLSSENIQECFSARIARHVSFPRNYFSMNSFPSWLTEQKKNVRTIAFPYGVGTSEASFVKKCISEFKALRMLDLHDSSFKVLPSSIVSLKHLKFLDISGNYELESLPTSICNLVGLETLNFSKCLNIEKLPRGFGQLIRLRTLGITTKELSFPEYEMRCLTSLRHLVITDCPNLREVVLDDAISSLSALRMLVIYHCTRLKTLPMGLNHLLRLETLSLLHCGSLDTSIYKHSDNNETRREGLRSLQFLSIEEINKLKSLPFWLLQGANNLKFIAIHHCQNATSLMEKQALMEDLRSLQTLWIYNCPKFQSLPAGMDSLAALDEVRIYDSPELVRRCRKDIGEDWHKISHVSNIYLDDIKI